MDVTLFGKVLKAFLLPVLRIALLAYVGLVIVLYFGQSNMVFFPRKEMAGSPQDAQLAFESVQLTTQDNVRLSAWFVPAAGADPTGKGVMLFCHGNAGNISHRVDYLSIFHQIGLATLIFDYRGYGSSEGQPSESGTYADVKAAWQYLTQVRQIPAHKIVAYGESLGGGVASYIAQKQRVGGLILASTFTSFKDRAAEIYPFLPVRWLSKFDYNTIARLSEISSPVLVIHSPADEVIPFHHGERLFAAARDPKMFVKLAGDHNNGFLLSERAYREGIAAFVRQYIRA